VTLEFEDARHWNAGEAAGAWFEPTIGFRNGQVNCKMTQAETKGPLIKLFDCVFQAA
jgi:hypothetical protein